MEDGDDQFFDTISISNRKRFRDSSYYLNSSRNTVYHSTVDLDMELRPLSQKCDDQDGAKRWRCFNNGQSSVDFVLAYHKNHKKEDVTKRETFEQNLLNVGLMLEWEENQRIHFVKIHIPKEVLCQYAEILKLRLPITKEADPPFRPNWLSSTIDRCLDCLKVRLDERIFPRQKYKLTAEFSKDKDYLFDVDSPDFFSVGIRIYIISYILEREKFGNDDQEKGMKRLLSEGIYKAAYPLHDGDLEEEGSKRHLLYKHWAQVGKCVQYQPLDEIKDYFGVKFALYFTWLGFYTNMLIPASIVGILCVIYASFTLHTDTVSADICELNITMCPLCDKFCDFWQLNASCTYAKIQHFIDNPATIFFAVFMSFWSVLYLELWKRYSAEIAHRWGLTGFDTYAEPPRAEYLIRLADAKKKKLNVVTLLQEPAVSFFRVRLPSLILSFTLAALCVCIVLAVVFGIIIYRMSLTTVDTLYQDKTSYRIYVVPITAAVLNLICIMLLSMFYDKLAVWLTEMELPRTQSQYDDSLAVKQYMFQFVNFYSSIFYIAFLKGKFVGYPMKYNKVLGLRQEECNPGGCLMELTIQLAIIMIGNQAINAVAEMVVPFLWKMYNTIQVTTGLKKQTEEEEGIISCNQWTEDYKLTEFDNHSLFAEYLEMVLQYGFVTIFVTAFPLAPLFALINNVLEMRLDAKKFIKYFRRPVPERVKKIGVWYEIMAIVGRISVASNAFIIAFSSHFIPKLVYVLHVSQDHTEAGFLNFTLATFDVADFPDQTAPENSLYNVTTCRYAEFRNPPNPPEGLIKYKRPIVYWHILAARLAFVVAYQNIVGFVISVVQWSIPDLPRKLNDQIKREAYRTNELIIKNETERARLRLRKQKHRESSISAVSGQTIYYDANGDLPHNSELPNNT